MEDQRVRTVLHSKIFLAWGLILTNLQTGARLKKFDFLI